MRQPTPTLPITPSMLRHFAAITVAITACIGMFASGESNEVAAKVAEQSRSSSSNFASINRAAPAVGAKKDLRSFNGINLASGTKLNSGGDGDAGGGSDGSGSGVGYIQPDPSAMRPPSTGPFGRPIAAGPGNGFGPEAAPPPMPTDAHGIPAPGAARMALVPPKLAKPPRKPTQQEIDRMMGGTSQPAGTATTN